MDDFHCENLKQIQAQPLLVKITLQLLQLPMLKVCEQEYPFNGSAPQSIQGTSADLSKCENFYLKFNLF